MQAFENSDRRLSWTGEPSEQGRGGANGYLLDETHVSLRLQGTKLDTLGIFNCQFEGGQWLEVEMGAVDFSCVRFRHTYFEKIDFSRCTFASVRFECCVFAGCLLNAGEDGLSGYEQIGCHSVDLPRSVAAPLEGKAAPELREKKQENPVPSAAVPGAPLAQDRFDRIER